MHIRSTIGLFALAACTDPSARLPTAGDWSSAGTPTVHTNHPTEPEPANPGAYVVDTLSPAIPEDTGPLDYAWEDPDWWVEPGPLQGLFDLELSDEAPHWRFWYITSPDLETWSEPTVLGHNFSSMDLLALDEGLILSGSLIPNPDEGIEGPFSTLFSLVTTDLETWGTHFFPVEGADELPMIIDPSVHADGDGYQMLFFAAGFDVDPEAMPDDYPNPHSIYTGRVGYDRIVVDTLEPIVQGNHIVDPSGCWWNGVHHILATNRYDDLFHQYRREEAPHYLDGVDWGGVQVPYCFIDERNDRMGLIAQHGGGHGPPRVRWCDADQQCEEQVAFVPEENLFDGQCTSPVLAYYNDQYVLFCSSWFGA